MKEIKLMSKPGLALIAITAISVSVAVQASLSSYYSIQSADAQQHRIPFELDAVRRFDTTTVIPGETNAVEVSCEPGETRTGGGFVTQNPEDVQIISNNPTGEDSWVVGATNTGDVERGYVAHVVCAILITSQGTPPGLTAEEATTTTTEEEEEATDEAATDEEVQEEQQPAEEEEEEEE